MISVCEGVLALHEIDNKKTELNTQPFHVLVALKMSH